MLAQGAIALVNHANYMWSVSPQDLYDIPDYTLLEIWNGQGSINNLGGDDGEGNNHPASEGYWDILLSRGKIVWGVAADDSHDFSEHANPHGAAAGQAWIVVHAPQLTAGAIKAALHNGDFYASTGVSLDDVISSKDELTVSIHERRSGTARYLTRFIGQGGKVLAEVAGTKPSYKFRGDEPYVRASIIDSNGNRAWTQPVFLRTRK